MVSGWASCTLYQY